MTSWLILSFRSMTKMKNRTTRKGNHYKNKSIHDGIVNLIKEHLEETGMYKIIRTNEEYSLRNGLFGECDVYAVRFEGGRYTALEFEIKSNHSVKNFNKAVKQLKKDQKYVTETFGLNLRHKKFYVCGAINDKGYTVRRVK